MSLTITASPPVIKVTDVDNTLLLDTSKSLFHITDTISGSISLTGWTPPVNSNREYTLGSCHTDSTFVRGAMRATYAGSPFAYFPNSGWFNVGASFVHVAYNLGIRFWSITAASGTVKLKDECYLHEIKNAAGQTLSSLDNITLAYYLVIGRFAP